MEAHSSSPLQRFRRWWKRVFFWQSVPAASREAVPTAATDKDLVAQITASQAVPGWRQLRYLSHVFSRKERWQFWSSIAAGLTFLLIGGGFFAQPHLARQPAQGGILTEGIIGAPKWVNPVLAPLNDVDRDLSALVFSGLFIHDGLDVRPDLAASTQLLDQNRTLEIRLREDARFHDGQALTADDVAFTINDAIKNPTWHSPLAEAFKGIQAVRVDEHTVQIKSETPITNLRALEDTLTVGILPANRWEDANDGSPQLAEANLKPVGSGPYQFESFTRDARGAILAFTLKRFPGYYGQSAYLDQRQFRFYPDRKAAETALESNQVDALAFVPWSEQARLRITDADAVQIELPQVTTVFFNTQDAVLRDPAVRSALQLTIDRGELTQLLPHTKPLQTPFPFLETYATSSQLVNLDAARQRLDDRRWKLNPADGLRYLQPPVVVPSTRARRGSSVATSTSASAAFSTSTPLTVTIIVPAQGDLPLVADYLKRRWSLIGANVKIEAMEREDIMRRALVEQTHQAVILNVLAPTDQDLAAFWQTGDNALNFSRWTSPATTGGFQSLAAATSTDAVAQARIRITDALLNDHVASFLLRPSYAYVVQNGVEGTRGLQILHPSDRLTAGRDWYLQTKLRWRSTP